MEQAENAAALRGGTYEDALEEALTAVVGQITAADARGWFTHCGYVRL